MPTTTKGRLEEARKLLDNFLERTGLSGTSGDPNRRYLWTDAYAVQACFGLAKALEEPTYHTTALKLIQLVHETLGRFHPDDEREGWISGLPEEEARKHPTAGGLRIGKELPERKEGEPLDERLEWQRDGQYFHYLTRWFAALMQAAEETEEEQYARWAAELILAGSEFIYKSGGQTRMYWKMSTTLSRPLVPSMGAQDPLEGLIATFSAMHEVPSGKAQLKPLADEFRLMCTGRDWASSDALGIGGLLLNTLKTALLAEKEVELPEPAQPEKLWQDSLRSLQMYAPRHGEHLPAEGRLPFRECGFTLGLRALQGGKLFIPEAGLELDPLEAYLPLAAKIENFWLEKENQRASTWAGHLDINAVTLAASLLAKLEPLVFG